MPFIQTEQPLRHIYFFPCWFFKRNAHQRGILRCRCLNFKLLLQKEKIIVFPWRIIIRAFLSCFVRQLGIAADGSSIRTSAAWDGRRQKRKVKKENLIDTRPQKASNKAGNNALYCPTHVPYNAMHWNSIQKIYQSKTCLTFRWTRAWALAACLHARSIFVPAPIIVYM
jgi:hypothetical protein